MNEKSAARGYHSLRKNENTKKSHAPNTGGQRRPPFLEEAGVEERFFLPFADSASPASSAFTLLSLAAGTEPALLLCETAFSLSLLGTETFGLECPPGLSAAMLSRSSIASVSFRLV
jgi:hypothetical protein